MCQNMCVYVYNQSIDIIKTHVLNTSMFNMLMEFWVATHKQNMFYILQNDYTTKHTNVFQQNVIGAPCLRMYCHAGVCAGAKSIYDRSPFHLPPVQQLVQIAILSSWVLTEEFKTWVVARFRRILQSQIAEDGFQREKVAARKQLNRTGREHLAYNTLIKSDLAEVVHKYKNPIPLSDTIGRNAQLDTTLFRPVSSNLSVKPKGLVSYTQKTSWHSPSATGLPVQEIDLDLCVNLQMGFAV